MASSPNTRSSRRLVLIHEFAPDQSPDFIAEQDDGIYLFRSRPPKLEISRLHDSDGHPEAVAAVALTHVKTEPLELNGSELTYLGERFSPDGKILGGQVLYRTSLFSPGDYTTVAEFPLGGLHLVAKKGGVRFFERIATGHDVYYEDGFLAWDAKRGKVSLKLDRLPKGAISTIPRYLHSFSHRQGDPAVKLGNLEFRLRRLRSGNDASWGLERVDASGAVQLITGEHETVSCARFAQDRLIYMRGPASTSTSPDAAVAGDNTLVCHLACDPGKQLETRCGPAGAWRLSAGRANLFHLHGELVGVSTDRLRIFRLK